MQSAIRLMRLFYMTVEKQKDKERSDADPQFRAKPADALKQDDTASV